MQRGLVGETVAILRWILGFVAARLFSDIVANTFFADIEPRQLAYVISFISIFIIIFLAMFLIRKLLTSLLSALGLGTVNKFLGGIFGLVKGLAVMTLVVIIGSQTKINNQTFWTESISIPFFEQISKVVLPYIHNTDTTEYGKHFRLPEQQSETLNQQEPNQQTTSTIIKEK